LAFTFRSPARALAAGLSRQDHIYKTTDEPFRFHNKNFDEMCCKLDSTENTRSIEIYPTPPQDYWWFAFTSFAFLIEKEKYVKEKALSPRSHPAS